MSCMSKLGLATALAVVTSFSGGHGGSALASVETIGLNIDHCTGGCLTLGGSGSVKVDDTGGQLSFDVELTGLFFQFDNGTGSGLNAFVFSLTGNPKLTFSAFTTDASGTFGGMPGSPPYHQDGFGNFEYAVSYAGTRDGTSLQFSVSDAANDLTLASLAQSSGGSPNVLFSADVFCRSCSTDGRTGPIGGSTAAVPEPATWAMMALGFAGLGFASYRKARPAISLV